MQGTLIVSAPNVPRARRWGFAALIGLITCAYVVFYARANPGFVSDFDQVWAGAAALWRGDNPYLAVGPGMPFHWHWPLYYPMPALVLAAPLGLLPVVAARTAFAGLSAALLAFAISRRGFERWPLFLSIPFMVNVELVQWSTLLTAVALLPSVAGIGVAKPNIGIALVAYANRSRTLWLMAAGGAALTGMSFLLLPNWMTFWIQNVKAAPHVSPLILLPGGPLLLAAVARWRRPEARLLVALACTPLTPTFYDPVLLYLVTRTFREALGLTVATYVMFFVVVFSGPIRTATEWGKIVSLASIWVVYLPCLYMVLRRPNTSDEPVP